MTVMCATVVFLVSLKAGGQGLNLVSASHVHLLGESTLHPIDFRCQCAELMPYYAGIPLTSSVCLSVPVLQFRCTICASYRTRNPALP